MAQTCPSRNIPDPDRSLQDAAHLFNLASNPVRLRILVSLVDGASTTEQICETLGRDRRLVNQYLHALAQANLVRSKRQGRSQVYTPTQSGHRLSQAARTLSGASESQPADLGNHQPPPCEDAQPSPPGQTDTVTRFVDLLKVFADPVRLRLLNLLRGKQQEVCVCHLHEALELPPSTVSRHLTTLRQAGLIVGRRHGTWVYYRLALPAHDLNHLMASYLDQDLFHSQVFQNDRRRLAGLGPSVDP
jgi:ArsR family transcriptional regulator